MSRNWVFVFPVALLIGGGYWIGTEYDRESRQIKAETAAANRFIQIIGDRETDRRLPLSAPYRKESREDTLFYLEYSKQHPEETERLEALFRGN